MGTNASTSVTQQSASSPDRTSPSEYRGEARADVARGHARGAGASSRRGRASRQGGSRGQGTAVGGVAAGGNAKAGSKEQRSMHVRWAGCGWAAFLELARWPFGGGQRWKSIHDPPASRWPSESA